MSESFFYTFESLPCFVAMLVVISLHFFAAGAVKIYDMIVGREEQAQGDEENYVRTSQQMPRKELDKLPNLSFFTLNISKNIIGSFILIIPWTFSQSGLLIGSLQMLLIYAMCVYSFCLIAYLGSKTNAKTYSLMFKSIGPWMVVIVDLSIIGIIICINAGYIIFIKLNIIGIVKQYSNYDLPSYIVVLVLAAAFLFPLSLIKELNSFRFFSLLSFGGVVFILIAAVVLGVTMDKTGVEYNLVPRKIYGLLVSFPLFAGNFDCHTNALKFYNEYEQKSTNKTFSRYVKVVAAAFSVVLAITAVFASVSYTTIGNVIEGDALQSYPKTAVIAAMRCAVIFSLVICYVLFLNSLRASLHFLVFSTILGRDEEMTKWHNAAETAAIVLATVAIAIPVDKIGYFNGCAWAIFGSLLVYIYPTVLAIKLGVLSGRIFPKANLFVLLFGAVVSMCLGFGTTMYDWVRSA